MIRALLTGQLYGDLAEPAAPKQPVIAGFDDDLPDWG